MYSSTADISLAHLAFEYWVKWEDCSNLKRKTEKQGLLCIWGLVGCFGVAGFSS